MNASAHTPTPSTLIIVPRNIPYIPEHMRSVFVRYIRSFDEGSDVSVYDQAILKDSLAKSILLKFTDANGYVTAPPNVIEDALTDINRKIKMHDAQKNSIICKAIASLQIHLWNVAMTKICAQETAHREVPTLWGMFETVKGYLDHPTHSKYQKSLNFFWYPRDRKTPPTENEVTGLSYASAVDARNLLGYLPNPQERIAQSDWEINRRERVLKKAGFLREFQQREVPSVVLEEALFADPERFSIFYANFRSALDTHSDKPVSLRWVVSALLGRETKRTLFPVIVYKPDVSIAKCTIPYGPGISMKEALRFSSLRSHVTDVSRQDPSITVDELSEKIDTSAKDSRTTLALLTQSIHITLLPNYEIALNSGIVPLVNMPDVRQFLPEEYDRWHEWMLDLIAPLVLRSEALDDFYGVSLKKPEKKKKAELPSAPKVFPEESVPVRTYPSLRDAAGAVAEPEREETVPKGAVGHKRLLSIRPILRKWKLQGYKPSYPSEDRRIAAKNVGMTLLEGIELVDVTPHQIIYPEKVSELLSSMRCKSVSDLVDALNTGEEEQVACIRYETYVSARVWTLESTAKGVRAKIDLVMEK